MTTLKNKKNKSKTIKLKNLKINSYISNMNGGNKDYKEEYIEILKQLEYYNRKHEKAQFKAKIYREAAEQLKNYKEKINSSKNIKDLPGIGKAITDKLDEYIKTGKVKNLEELKKMYFSMSDILNHNYSNLVFNNRQTKLFDQLTDFPKKVI